MFHRLRYSWLFVLPWVILLLLYVTKQDVDENVNVKETSAEIEPNTNSDLPRSEAETILLNIRSNFNPYTLNVKSLGEAMLQLAEVRREYESKRVPNKNLFEDITKTEKLVYPFLLSKHGTFDNWRASYSGKGIVTTGAPHHMRYVVFLIKNLKAVNCNLPIQFVSESAEVLSDQDKSRLTELGVEILYLTDIIDPNFAKFESYAMKLAAMFVSSFQEAIFLDIDDVFIKNPELLYDDVDYKTTGTLFYPDQPEKNDGFERRDWLLANLPHPLSDRVLNSKMFKGFAREVDSAAIVMDKVRNFNGLLSAVRLNLPRERDQLRTIFGGDAELWWIGFEMVRASYALSPFPAGAIGPVLGDEVCGKTMHVGRDERPFFWNQGFVTLKGINTNDLTKFEGFVRSGTVHLFLPFYCVKGNGAVRLNDEELEVISRLKEIWVHLNDFTKW